MRKELASQLVAVQQRHLSLDEFELWLVGNLQRILDEDNAEIKAYADKLDALLIQYGEEVLSFGELDDAIESILRNLNTIVDEESVFTTPSSSVSKATTDSRDMEIPFRDLGAVQDLRHPGLVLA